MAPMLRPMVRVGDERDDGGSVKLIAAKASAPSAHEVGVDGREQDDREHPSDHRGGEPQKLRRATGPSSQTGGAGGVVMLTSA
ncbi:MAG: hypothetical protein IPI35_20920 [Deltaproteobacteria bacterium]|nr:hypothetical protein [Deltaproteobacteria bacterium]